MAKRLKVLDILGEGVCDDYDNYLTNLTLDATRISC